VKIDEVHNCENDYYCQQAENEDVADIVASYARASAFSILLIWTGTPISLFIFRCYLIGHILLANGVPQLVETIYLAASEDAFRRQK
jgi:hypothetical protein